MKLLLVFLLLYRTGYGADINLTWIAPGDDGDVGTAALYDMRYSTDSMVVVNWTNAVQGVGEPLPQISGTREYYTLTGFPDPQIAPVFIALKARDEAFNWSPLTNIVKVADVIPPETIVDLDTIP
jgi:hypothetical protein